MRLINTLETNSVSGGGEFKTVAKLFTAADTIVDIINKLMGEDTVKKK